MFVMFFVWLVQFLLSTLLVNKTFFFFSTHSILQIQAGKLPTPCGLLALGTERSLLREGVQKMLIFRGHCKRSSAPGQNILRHLERKVSSTLSSQSPVKAGWGMTDVTLKEGDTCPGPGWVPGRPPHDTEQATVSLNPGFSFTKCCR